MSEAYFLVQEGERTGPWTRLQIIARIEEGEADAETLIWNRGAEGWEPLGEKVEFEGVFRESGESGEKVEGGVAEEERGESEETDQQKVVSNARRVSPWLRAWARGVDVIVLMMFVSWAGTGIWPMVMGSLGLGVVAVMVFAMMVVEAGMLTLFGTTPGKSMLSLHVRTLDGRRPTFSAALSRSVLLGVVLALCIYVQPVILVVGFLGFRELRRKASTMWDRRGGVWVLAAPLRPFGTAVALMICVSFVWLIYALIWPEMNKMIEEGTLPGMQAPGEVQEGDGGGEESEPGPSGGSV